MVNYCIVSGCGRNNKYSKHLYFYSLPKETIRQVQWLKLADREDLLNKRPEKRITYRICSRHFSRDKVKNKHLCADAIPDLFLPGSSVDEKSAEDVIEHEDIVCDNCSTPIHGFRYKCINCPDYDLCSACEMLETHPEHFMIRMPKPLKCKLVENIITSFRNFLGSRVEVNNTPLVESSDDEPITKYAKTTPQDNYDSGISLSEEIKTKIKFEVKRIMKIKSVRKSKKSSKKVKSKEEFSTRDKTVNNFDIDSKKEPKLETVASEIRVEGVPEVVFADVNDMNAQIIDDTLPATISDPVIQPVVNIKLNDDLTQLMIEMNDQKTIYKFD